MRCWKCRRECSQEFRCIVEDQNVNTMTQIHISSTKSDEQILAKKKKHETPHLDQETTKQTHWNTIDYASQHITTLNCRRDDRIKHELLTDRYASSLDMCCRKCAGRGRWWMYRRCEGGGEDGDGTTAYAYCSCDFKTFSVWRKMKMMAGSKHRESAIRRDGVHTLMYDDIGSPKSRTWTVRRWQVKRQKVVGQSTGGLAKKTHIQRWHRRRTLTHDDRWEWK